MEGENQNQINKEQPPNIELFAHAHLCIAPFEWLWLQDENG